MTSAFTIHAHPTLSETVMMLEARSADGTITT